MGNDETVWLDLEIKHQTPKAFLVIADVGGDTMEVWIPKSQLRGRRMDGDTRMRAEVTRWFAVKEGLIDDKDTQ